MSVIRVHPWRCMIAVTTALLIALSFAVEQSYWVLPESACWSVLLCMTMVLSMTVAPVAGSLAVIAANVAMEIAPLVVDAFNGMMAYCGLPLVSVPYLPLAMTVAGAVAVGMLAFDRWLWGLVSAAAWWCCGALSLVWSGAGPAMWMAALAVCVSSGVALLVGMAARWRCERETARRSVMIANEAMRIQAQGLDAAARLHDDVTNRLSMVVLQADVYARQSDDPQSGQFEELRDALTQVLDRTHAVIRILDRRDAPARNEPDEGPERPRCRAAESSRITVTSHDIVDPTAAVGRIHELTTAYDQRLASLGFSGETVVCGVLAGSGMTTACLTCVETALRELYANIIKHADGNAGYAVSVSFRTRDLAITVVDMARDSGDGESRSPVVGGSGLIRLRDRLLVSGGSLAWDDPAGAGEWGMRLVVPYDAGARRTQ